MAELASIVELLDDDVRRIDLAINEAKYAEEISDPEKASEAAHHAIAIAQIANLPLQEAQGYYEWGMSLYRLGRYDESLERMETCLALAQERRRPQTASGSNACDRIQIWRLRERMPAQRR